jgi:hypothetical protein
MGITSTNVATAITKLTACAALPALIGNLIMGNLANRDFEPTVAQVGEFVTVSIPPVGHAEIKLTRHAEATFQVPDVTKVLAVPDLLALYMQPAIMDLVEQIETDVLAHLYSLSNTVLGGAGVPITGEDIERANTALFMAKISPSHPKYLVVDAPTFSVMRRMPRFLEFNTAGEAGLRTLVDGPVGKIKDFFVFRSRFVAKTGSAPEATHNVAFAKGAICMVIRRLPNPLPGTGAIAEYAELGNFGMRVMMNYRPNTLSQQFTIGALYGCGVIHPEQTIELLT